MRLALRNLLIVGGVLLVAGATGCQLLTDTGGLVAGDTDGGEVPDAGTRAAPDASAPVSGHPDATAGDASDAGAGADARPGPVDSGVGADVGPVVPPAIGEDGGALPGPPSSKCSVDSSVPTTIVIANHATVTIEIWWVDYSCVEHDYGDIPIGGMATLGTFVSHPWRIRADGTHALLRDIPPSTDAAPRTIDYP